MEGITWPTEGAGNLARAPLCAPPRLEAARVSDELYQSIRLMLAVSGGRIVLLSTGFGKPRDLVGGRPWTGWLSERAGSVERFDRRRSDIPTAPPGSRPWRAGPR